MELRGEELSCYLNNFYWATTTIKGRLLSSRPMLKPFSGEKILSPVEMKPQNGGFGENGGRYLRFWFRDPNRHFLARKPLTDHVISRMRRNSYVF